MTIYTMGFAGKSAEEFFKLINKNNIELLLDIRLNNQSQLAAFTKGRDLEYFTTALTKAKYVHETDFAPDKDFLSDYKKGKISWDDYIIRFNKLMKQRNVVNIFNRNYSNYENILLLCSEPTPEKCHRRLLAEELAPNINAKIIHL